MKDFSFGEGTEDAALISDKENENPNQLEKVEKSETKQYKSKRLSKISKSLPNPEKTKNVNVLKK